MLGPEEQCPPQRSKAPKRLIDIVLLVWSFIDTRPPNREKKYLHFTCVEEQSPAERKNSVTTLITPNPRARMVINPHRTLNSNISTPAPQGSRVGLESQSALLGAEDPQGTPYRLGSRISGSMVVTAMISRGFGTY